MACCPKSIIEDVLKKHDKITHVYFVACGGSYAGLYPAKYFLQSEAKDLIIGHYSSNEFCHATPKALGKDSIVITQSFSGTRPLKHILAFSISCFMSSSSNLPSQ